MAVTYGPLLLYSYNSGIVNANGNPLYENYYYDYDLKDTYMEESWEAFDSEYTRDAVIDLYQASGKTYEVRHTSYGMISTRQITAPTGMVAWVNIEIDNVSVFGAKDGSIYLTKSASCPPAYNITSALWADDPIQAVYRNGLGPGMYQATAYAFSLPIALAPIEVLSPDQSLDFTGTVTPATAYGRADGKLALTAIGGLPPYIFTFPDGTTLEGQQVEKTGLSAGTYTVVLSDGNSTRQRIFTVTSPAQLTCVAEVMDRSVRLLISGGTAPYNAIWEDGYLGTTRQDVAYGEWEVFITDAVFDQIRVVFRVGALQRFYVRNPVDIELETTDPDRPHLSAIVEVHVEEQYRSGKYAKRVALQQPYQEGKVKLDIASVLQADAIVPAPPTTFPSVRRLDGHFFRFFVQHADRYGNPPVTEPYLRREVCYAIAGGVSELTLARPTAPTLPAWCSWREGTRYWANEDDPQVLSYMCRDGANIQVMIDAEMRNGEFKVFQFSQITAPAPNEIFAIGVHAQAVWNMARGFTDRYWVYLQQGGSIITPKIQFEYAPQRNYRQVLYLNALGGWDIYTIASARFTDKFKVTTATDGRTRQEVLQDKQGTAEVKLTSLMMSDAEAEEARDLLCSRQVYIRYDGRWLPVILQAGSISWKDDSEPGIRTFEVTALIDTYTNYTPVI